MLIRIQCNIYVIGFNKINKKDTIQFVKLGNMHRIIGNHDSLLGSSFAENIQQNSQVPQIIEVEINHPKNNKDQLSKKVTL